MTLRRSGLMQSGGRNYEFGRSDAGERVVKPVEQFRS